MNIEQTIIGVTIAIVVVLVLFARWRKMKESIVPFYLYADASPDETIKKSELPGLAVACILPHKKGQAILDVPIGQYKKYKKPGQKIERALELAGWLKKEREEGLEIPGFLLARSQRAAARYGLDVIEELPDTYVEEHHGGYRLYFGNEYISFPQAVALVYYTFAINFGVLFAGKRIKKGYRNIVVFMDTFPAASPGELQPGERPPKTPGMKFIEFVRARSETAIGIDESNAKLGIKYKEDNLVWWRYSNNENWLKGKSHPHFTLADWLVACALAKNFKKEFIDNYPHKIRGGEVAGALCELYDEFKKFTIFELADDNSLDHIVSNSKQWEVPDKAREFVLAAVE